MIEERFQRLAQLIGPAGLQRLRQSRVTVVGLGAVGSYATEALARAGIGNLTLVDFDLVQPTNLNRQLFALHSTLGRPKVEVAAERVHDINPDCRVTARPLFVHTDTLAQLWAEPPDLLVEAIDSFNPKLELLAEVVRREQVVVSCMGAALRTDPSRIRCGLLTGASGCPLARRLRKKLRQRGLGTDIWCVYSDEPADPAAVAEPPPGLPEGQGRLGRPRRTLGSLPTVTGIFGLTVANEALRLLLGGSFPDPVGEEE